MNGVAVKTNSGVVKRQAYDVRVQSCSLHLGVLADSNAHNPPPFSLDAGQVLSLNHLLKLQPRLSFQQVPENIPLLDMRWRFIKVQRRSLSCERDGPGLVPLVRTCLTQLKYFKSESFFVNGHFYFYA
jgi:hypothetical protein